MRDPDRIDSIVDVLREVWKLNPDLRLGQLIYNAARIQDPDLSDVYSLEDGSILKGLLRYQDETLNSPGRSGDDAG